MLLTHILKYPNCDGSREDASVFYSTLYEVHGPEGASLSILKTWEYEEGQSFEDFKKALAKEGLALKEAKMYLVGDN